ncbi:serine/threonine protein kinase [Pendulispora brunnea]|uniref:Serine/threonine protein kinase n=1 Tax=Pendulispora brunnea TaxID=2905690 RepID=A0ABZ2KRG1_9BACT
MKRLPSEIIGSVQWEKHPLVFGERFDIEREAGLGGTSIVYRARDRVTGAPVALKVMRTTHPSALRRLDAEARALEMLQHPAVVRYVAHGVGSEGEPYLAMEWIDGETLAARLQRRALDVHEVVKLGRCIAEALTSAHALGILHRDVKPSNVLLPERAIEQAKLADFGLARSMGIERMCDVGSQRTATGTIIGTPGYMAPEQAHGIADLDARADLFSLGCLLFRCLTDAEAFEGSRALTALAKLVLLEPPRVIDLRPDVPAALDDLVAALLAKERDLRPASAEAVREALERIERDVQTRAVRGSRNDLELLPGMVFGRYVLEERLGVGGMGELFRAFDTTLRRPVALKMLRGSPDRETSARLVREARAAATLSHPNIVIIYDVGVHETIPFLASECITGKNLRTYVGDPSVDLRRRVRWLMAIAGGLDAAHRAGVVHGDVKPDNVMVGDDGAIKLVDFGLATAMTAGIMGTPAYMAPEQIRGEPLDGLTDQFAWGVTAHELLTGELPWPGNDPLAAMASVLEGQPRDMHLPHEIAGVIRRALSKRPEDRFPTMEALLAALEPSVKVAPVRKRSRRFGWIAASLVVLGLVLHAFLPRKVSAPMALTAPSPTSVVGLPVSSACAPAAAELHREGLKALRAANWKRATTLFEKAAAIDPACPETQLRLTVIPRTRWSRARQMEQLGRTLAIREKLSERDRLLLDAYAQLISPELPDENGATRFLDEGVRRFPEDAELRVLAALRHSGVAMLPHELEGLLTMVRRATEIDPLYADAWQLQSHILCRLGRHDEEIHALDRCLELSPEAVDCMEDRSVDLRRTGRCSEAVTQARKWVASEADQPWAYGELANALAGTGTSRAEIEEALSLRWKNLPPEERELARLRDSAELEIWAGDFDAALRIAEQLKRRVTGSETIEKHLSAALISVEALREMGRGRDAALIAEGFFRRDGVWIRGDPTLASEYAKPSLFATALEHGQMTTATWKSATEVWEQNTRVKIDSFKRWVLRWGPAVGSRIEATEAMLRDPRHEAGEVPMIDNAPMNMGVLEAYEGHMRLLAGDITRAIPLLETAAQTCQGPQRGALHVRSHLWLGAAKEKASDMPGACEAYRFVLQRWGAARPRSVTAEEAARRSRALGCPL